MATYQNHLPTKIPKEKPVGHEPAGLFVSLSKLNFDFLSLAFFGFIPKNIHFG